MILHLAKSVRFISSYFCSLVFILFFRPDSFVLSSFVILSKKNWKKELWPGEQRRERLVYLVLREWGREENKRGKRREGKVETCSCFSIRRTPSCFITSISLAESTLQSKRQIRLLNRVEWCVFIGQSPPHMIIPYLSKALDYQTKRDARLFGLENEGE